MINAKQAQTLKPGMTVKCQVQGKSRTVGRNYVLTGCGGSWLTHKDDHGELVTNHIGQYTLVSTNIETTHEPVIEPMTVPVVAKNAADELDDIPMIDAAIKTLAQVANNPSPVNTTEQDFKKLLCDSQDISAKIVAVSLEQGQRMAKDMIAMVEASLDEVRRKSNTVLQVKINDAAIAKLKTQAVPFLKRMIVSAKIGKNIMLVGPAGCGKTTAAAQLSEALGIKFYHNTVTAGASETWFLGRQTPAGFQPGPLHVAYKEGGVYLADEYDAGDANLLVMFNTMLENGHFYNPFNGEELKRHKDFVFIAACNTYGKGADSTYTGRNRLDAASLRRFAGSTIAVDYDESIERAVCPDDSVRTALQKVRAELKRLNSTEIVSTGCLKNTYDLMQQSIPFKDIAESLCLSWSPDLKKLMTQAVKEVKEA